MDEQTKKSESKSGKEADIIPVNKEQQIASHSPRHLLTPFEEMERWIEDFFPRSWLFHTRREWPSVTSLEARMPKVDVIDRDDEVFIKAELPGIDKKDVEVSMSENMITIKGASRKEEKKEKGDYYRSEITQGAFSRSMSLPAEVNIEKSKATFKNGILELRLPKLERTKRRNIKID